MINIIESEKRYHADFGWLDTRWHFSFSDYHDPKNMNWGPLRVFNDDIVHGGGGFGMHPHRDMEIITYMIGGELKHMDSLGHGGVLRGGEVQVMSAGKGIMHAEFNNSKTEPLRLLQIWIMPRTENLPPRWEQRNFTDQQRRNALLPVVSSGNIAGTLAIDQDAAVYVASLDSGKEIVHKSAEHRHAYVFVISGAIELNGRKMAGGDQARIADEPTLALRATEPAEIILLDLP
jgi:redox-sensitive bicupin YhaK (pirin superfamily)